MNTRSHLLCAAGLLLAVLSGKSFANSSVTDAADPLLPGQKATVNHCEGRIYDSNNNGSFADTADMRYRVFLPPGYDPAISYPVVLWLHGLGAEGTNNTSQLSGDKATVLHLLDEPNRYNFPCILIAPQRQTGEWYGGNKSSVFGILTDVAAQYSIDRKRIYLCGVSYGAFGTYAFLTNSAPADPFHFAAGVAISGNGGQSGAAGKTSKLVGFPFWAFHASNDTTVDIYSGSGTDVMIDNIRANGGSPIYTRFSSGNHTEAVWDSAFSTPGLLAWMMSQRLENETTGQRETSGSGPGVIVTGYRVGATLDMEGVLQEPSGLTSEVSYFSSNVGNRTGTTTQTAGGSTITITGANFTSADVGSRLFFNNADYDTWNGYKITSIVSSTSVKVSPSVTGVTFPVNNVGYEIDPPGHRRNPAAVTGIDTWTASGIPLVAGNNIVGMTGKTTSWANGTQGGSSSLGGQTVSVNFTAPSGDTVAPQLTAGNAVVTTTASTISLSGTATDNVGVTAVTWTTDHAGSGSASGTTSWVASAIPLDPGNNTVTVKAIDSTGNIAVKIIRVMRNLAPTAAPVSATTQKDTGCTIDVLPSGSDADVQPQTLSVSSVGTAAHGTASVYGRQVRYLPAAGYSGADNFSYTLTDGNTTVTSQVNVTVGGTLTTASTTYFSQDYSSSGTVGSYMSGTPDSGQVNDIGANTDGGAWSINNGKLQLVKTGASGSANGAGMTRSTDLAGPPQFVKVSFEYALSGQTAYASDLEFDLCSLTSVGSYNSTLNNNSVRDRLVLLGKGTGSMVYSLGGMNSANVAADGTPHQVVWYVNGSATSKQYRGADGFAYQVGPNRSSLWVDGVLLWDNIPRLSSFTGTSMADFRIRSTVASAITLTLDNLSIAEQVTTIGSGDTTPPVVTITSPTTTLTTSAALTTLAGTASDNEAVTSVTWSNDNGDTGTATGTTTWSVPNITLHTGQNVLSVTASDALGNTSTSTLTVTYNQPPAAGTVSCSLDESSSADVDVLASGSDPDGWPQALTLTGVGSAAHGTATIVSGKVHYVPERGYYGSDSVSYTISDGVASTTGTVNFTVNNTALAMDLSAFGMGSPAIGTSSGGSRELSTHQWEVTGAGVGLGGTGDAFQGQLQSVCGDFTMVVKTDELQGAAGTRLGLVAREGFAAGDRMVGISIGLDGTVKYVVRSTAGGTATETAVSGTFPVSGTWLMIKKVGNTLSAATSSDDVTYTQVVTQNLSQLSSTLQAGLWVAGGSGGASGRGVVSSFAVEQDTVNLAQNFDAWGATGVIADYINSTPGQDTLQDIGAEADGGTWSIESTNDVGTHYNGKLKLVRAASTGANNAAGFTRLSGTLPAMQKLVVSFKVSVSGINTNSDLGYLDLANLTALQDYSATSPSAGMTNRLTLKGGGNGTFKIQINSVNSGTYAANGTEIQVKWYLNHSGSTVSYTGPDLSAQSLAAGTGDLWINGVRIFDDAGRNAAFLGTTTRGVRFRTTTDQPMTLLIDDLDLSELP